MLVERKLLRPVCAIGCEQADKGDMHRENNQAAEDLDTLKGILEVHSAGCCGPARDETTGVPSLLFGSTDLRDDACSGDRRQVGKGEIVVSNAGQGWVIGAVEVGIVGTPAEGGDGVQRVIHKCNFSRIDLVGSIQARVSLVAHFQVHERSSDDCDQHKQNCWMLVPEKTWTVS